MSLKMIRKIDSAVILENGVCARSYFDHLLGLMGKASLANGEGMFFPNCNSIHMWMMKISIDVLFLKKQEKDWIIVSIHSKLKPWKLLPVTCFRANDTLELPAGTIDRLQLRNGEVLCIA